MTVDRYLRLIAGAFVVISVALGLLGESVLVFIRGFCRFEFISIGIQQLVPDDGHTAQGWRKV